MIKKYYISDDNATLLVEYDTELSLFELALYKRKLKSKDHGQLVCTVAEFKRVYNKLKNHKSVDWNCTCCANCSFLRISVDPFEKDETFINRYVAADFRHNIKRYMPNEMVLSTEKLIKFFQNILETFEK